MKISANCKCRALDAVTGSYFCSSSLNAITYDPLITTWCARKRIRARNSDVESDINDVDAAGYSEV